jgi:uncharacterized protein
MNNKLACIVLLCCLGGCSHRDSDKDKGDIVVGKFDNVGSAILGEQRKIWVHVPGDHYAKGTEHYPVVYLLDGDAHFPSVMGLIQQLSEVNGNTVLPQMILVGIPNTDRMRDLTPTKATTGYTGDSASVKGSGGGERFAAFIEKELIPHIDSMYPTAPYRVLIGHSLGGLTVINMLVHHPQVFNAYLAIDPSMWWDQQRLLKEADTALTGARLSGKTLFMGIANTMQPGMDTARVRNDTANTTLHIRSILRLADEFGRDTANGLRWNYKYYDGDNHGSVPLISEYDGLRFIFNFYRFSNGDLIYNASTTAAWSIAAVRDHYKIVSEHMGYTVLPPEDYINEMGYNCLELKMPDKSREFFALNIENYPKDGNAYDSMGDYYAAVGEKARAIDYYTKAQTFRDDPETKRKLEKLKQ